MYKALKLFPGLAFTLLRCFSLNEFEKDFNLWLNKSNSTKSKHRLKARENSTLFYNNLFTEVYYIINREDKTEFNYENLNVHQREPYLNYFFEARFKEIRNNIAETLEKIRHFDYDTVDCQMDVGAYVKNYLGLLKNYCLSKIIVKPVSRA